jgi:hypothetical protein
MKKLLAILSIITLVSCSGNVETNNDALTMDAHKFEYDGNHYIQFEFVNNYGGGVTIDPDYLFKGDTIIYGGNKYVKLNQ